MVKPVIKALKEIKAAETADAAQRIAIDFLKSDDAKNVNNSQAGTFIASLKQVFAKAPNHHEAVLLTVKSKDVKVSEDFKTFAGFALTDLAAHTNYVQDAGEILLANAKILKGFAEPKPTGFQFAKQYGPTTPESSAPAYPELVHALTTNDLKLALNQILSEQDITEEKAQGFFNEVIAAFEALQTPPDEQEKLLGFIQESTSSYSVLIDLTDNHINGLTEAQQGPRPRTAFTGGIDFQPS